jgi:hypothetical protein
MTFTLSEIALFIMALSAFMGVLAIYNLRRRLGGAADETQTTMRRLGELSPRLEQNLDELAETLRELRKLTKHTEGVAADAEAISGEVRAGVEAIRIARRSRAAAAAAKAGFLALREVVSSREGNGGPQDDFNERTGRRERPNE